MEESKFIAHTYVDTMQKNTEREMRRKYFSVDDALKDEADVVAPEPTSSDDEVFRVRSISLGDFANSCPNPEVVTSLKYLWSSPSIQKAYERRNEFQLMDSASYFLNDLDRICVHNYEPTDDDILYARARTTGIAKIEFAFRHLTVSTF